MHPKSNFPDPHPPQVDHTKGRPQRYYFKISFAIQQNTFHRTLCIIKKWPDFPYHCHNQSNMIDIPIPFPISLTRNRIHRCITCEGQIWRPLRRCRHSSSAINFLQFGRAADQTGDVMCFRSQLEAGNPVTWRVWHNWPVHHCACLLVEWSREHYNVLNKKIIILQTTHPSFISLHEA